MITEEANLTWRDSAQRESGQNTVRPRNRREQTDALRCDRL
jgi:hypothetical protein